MGWSEPGPVEVLDHVAERLTRTAEFQACSRNSLAEE